MDFIRIKAASSMSRIAITLPLIVALLVVPREWMKFVAVLGLIYWVVSVTLLYIYLPPKRKIRPLGWIKNPWNIAMAVEFVFVLLICYLILPERCHSLAVILLLIAGIIVRGTHLRQMNEQLNDADSVHE